MFAEMMSKVDNHIDFIIEMVNNQENKKEVPENLKDGFESSFDTIKNGAMSFFRHSSKQIEYQNGFIEITESEDEDDW